MPTALPKFDVGDLVDVTEYYADLIPKSYFCGLILGFEVYHIFGDTSTIIYTILGCTGENTDTIQRAEEFAISLTPTEQERIS